MEKLRMILRSGYNYRFLLNQLIIRNIKLKYRKSYLGVCWSLIEPLMTMIVLSFVFGKLLGRGDKYFPIYVLSGRLMYSFFSVGTKSAMKSIRKNASIIKKVYVPKYMYPLSSCTAGFIIFLVSLIDLFLVMVVMRMDISLRLLGAVLPVLVLYLFTFGVGMLLTSVNVFFRDVEYMWDVGLMLVMYTSAIFYKLESFAESGKDVLFRLNPLCSLIQCFRNCIYGEPMEWNWLLYALGVSILCSALGLLIFKKKQDEFVLHV